MNNCTAVKNTQPQIHAWVPREFQIHKKPNKKGAPKIIASAQPLRRSTKNKRGVVRLKPNCCSITKVSQILNGSAKSWPIRPRPPINKTPRHSSEEIMPLKVWSQYSKRFRAMAVTIIAVVKLDSINPNFVFTLRYFCAWAYFSVLYTPANSMGTWRLRRLRFKYSTKTSKIKLARRKAAKKYGKDSVMANHGFTLHKCQFCGIETENLESA